MITGDLVRHKNEDDSFGVVMSLINSTAQVLWLDHDHPAVEWYPQVELNVTSSTDVDWEDSVLIFKS